MRAALLALLLPACGTQDRPATWSYLSTAVFEPNCAAAGCHSTLARTANIVLEGREAGYQSLVRRRRPFVVPGDPTSSRLLYLLDGDVTIRMPPDAPLPAADIDLVEEWILLGARND
ncbi:MAG: hypothetical protein AABZ30_07865 [Myxococcota bacterium]